MSARWLTAGSGFVREPKLTAHSIINAEMYGVSRFRQGLLEVGVAVLHTDVGHEVLDEPSPNVDR